MSTVSKFLPKVPDGFSTQIASATVSSTELSVTLDSTSGLPTEGVGQFFKKDANGEVVAGSVEFCHWTGVSGNSITFSDTGDRGVTGSDSGAQSYVADDYFEVWVSSYYVDGNTVDHNGNGSHKTLTDANGNEWIKQVATASAVNEITVTNAAAGNSPIVSATGGDDNVGMDFKMKGTGKMRKPTVVGVQVLDSATNTAVGDGKAFFRVPAELNGMNLTGVAAAVYTAGTTNTTDIQIRNVTDSADMLSTKLTIDSGETDSATAATAAVIDATKDDVATGDVLAIDVDAVSTTPAKGLYVEMRFELP